MAPRNSNSIAGWLLVALGGGLTVASLEGGWSVQRFWPLLVVAFGTSRLASRGHRMRGLALLVTGVVVQLSNLGLFNLPSSRVVRYWPLILVVIAAWELDRFRGSHGLMGRTALLLLGVWLQLSYFGLVHISSFHSWPLILSAVGIGMLRR
jgi:hypothetical protein